MATSPTHYRNEAYYLWKITCSLSVLSGELRLRRVFLTKSRIFALYWGLTILTVRFLGPICLEKQ